VEPEAEDGYKDDQGQYSDLDSDVVEVDAPAVRVKSERREHCGDGDAPTDLDALINLKKRELDALERERDLQVRATKRFKTTDPTPGTPKGIKVETTVKLENNGSLERFSEPGERVVIDLT
jgi:hypothetical protein